MSNRVPLIVLQLPTTRPTIQPQSAYRPGARVRTGRTTGNLDVRDLSLPNRYSEWMRGRFRVVDPACLEVLQALQEAFDHEGVRFAVAGGMGVQALLAAAGLDHLLRSTGDVDVVVDADDSRVVRALNHLAAAHPNMTVVQNPAAKNARVGPLNIDWINEPSRLRGLEEAWAGSIELARVVKVRRLTIPVQQPEVLVAAKLTGHKVRPQDELDIAGVLQSGTRLDGARLRQLLISRPDRFEVFEEIRENIPDSGVTE